jgi:hypothetical protein
LSLSRDFSGVLPCPKNILPTERNQTIGTFYDERSVKIHRILSEKLKIDIIQIAGCIL